MSFVLVILVSLVLTTPATIIYDGPIVLGLLAAVAAVALVMVGFSIRPREAGFLSNVITPVGLAAVFPAIWILVQVIPIPGGWGLAHPMWKSAAEAIESPMVGSISIDPGATLISFVRYLSLAGIAFVTAAAAIDRRRAEWIFFALTVSVGLIGFMSVAMSFGVFTLVDAKEQQVAAIDCAGLGIIVTLAAAFHVWEPSEARKRDSTTTSRLGAAVWLISLAICLLSVIIGATGATYFAVIFGVTTLVAIVAIRQLNLGSWGAAAIMSVMLLAAIAAIAFQPGVRTLDLTLAFATRAPTQLIAVTQRLVSETAWTGTGSGTFAAILPVYQDVDELATGRVAPTAAAAILVEMGRPFFWIILMAASALAFALARGALSRRRDFILFSCRSKLHHGDHIVVICECRSIEYINHADLLSDGRHSHCSKSRPSHLMLGVDMFASLTHFRTMNWTSRV